MHHFPAYAKGLRPGAPFFSHLPTRRRILTGMCAHAINPAAQHGKQTGGSFMVPHVLGVYVSRRRERAGMGVTSRSEVQKIHWLAASAPEGGAYLVQPLTDAYLPSGLVHRLPEQEFLQHFLPDAACFDTRIRPQAEALGRHFHALAQAPFSVENFGPLALPFEQLRLLDGLLAVLRGKAGLVPREQDVPGLRTLLADMLLVRSEPDFQNRITAAAIDLRRQGDYEAAEQYYERALAVQGQEDRLLFNLARVRYDAGRVEQAEECLRRALAANPEFDEAERFLRFILTEGTADGAGPGGGNGGMGRGR